MITSSRVDFAPGSGERGGQGTVGQMREISEPHQPRQTRERVALEPQTP